MWWEPRDPSQADDAGRLSRFVSAPPDFDPIYRSWLKSPETKKETVPVPLGEAEAKQLLIDNVARGDVPPDPKPEWGSEVWGGHAGPPPFDFRKSSYADTKCCLGAFGRRASVHPNHVFMRLSALRPSTGRPWRASELRPLMRFARDVWNPAEMCAMFSFDTLDLPKIPDPVRVARLASQIRADVRMLAGPLSRRHTANASNLLDRLDHPSRRPTSPRRRNILPTSRSRGWPTGRR